jgi:catechol 2,3-dioxygenase-like lactoylglutathione lyase family enzyme
MDMKLEVVVLPVIDVDRAKRFYLALGWRLDADVVEGSDLRGIQLTPPGSPSSIVFGTGVSPAGSGPETGLHLAVRDIDAARDESTAAGVAVSDTFHDAGGVFHHGGSTGRVPGPDRRKAFQCPITSPV